MFITYEKARRATAAAQRAIRTQTVADGVPKLLAFCRAQDGDDPVWAQLEAVDWVADARVLGERLIAALGSSDVTPEHTGLWVGLAQSGLELGLAVASDDPEWPCQCTTYLELTTPGLETIGRTASGMTVVCALLQGYCGMAIREALARAGDDALGGAPFRRVVLGPHDGGLLPLGTLEPGGLSQPPDAEPEAPRPPQRWPLRSVAVNEDSSIAQWILSAAADARDIEDPKEREAALTAALDLLVRSRVSPEHDADLRAAADYICETSGESDIASERVTTLLAAAATYRALRDEGTAGQLLDRAETIAHSITEEYAADEARADVQRARDGDTDWPRHETLLQPGQQQHCGDLDEFDDGTASGRVTVLLGESELRWANGDREGAIEAALAIPDAESRREEVVPKMVASGRLADALQQIRSEGAPAVRVNLLLEAADVRLSVSRRA